MRAGARDQSRTYLVSVELFSKHLVAHPAGMGLALLMHVAIVHGERPLRGKCYGVPTSVRATRTRASPHKRHAAGTTKTHRQVR